MISGHVAETPSLKRIKSAGTPPTLLHYFQYKTDASKKGKRHG